MRSSPLLVLLLGGLLAVAMAGAGGFEPHQEFKPHQEILDEKGKLLRFLEWTAKTGEPEQIGEALFLMGLLQLDPPPILGSTADPAKAEKLFERALKSGSGHVGACERLAELRYQRCGDDVHCLTQETKWRDHCSLIPVLWENQDEPGRGETSADCYVDIGGSRPCRRPKVKSDPPAAPQIELQKVPGYEFPRPPWIQDGPKDAFLLTPPPGTEPRPYLLGFRATRYEVQSDLFTLRIHVSKKKREQLAYAGYLCDIASGWGLRDMMDRHGEFEAVNKVSDLEVLKSLPAQGEEISTGLVFANSLVDPGLAEEFRRYYRVDLAEKVQYTLPIFQVAAVVIVMDDRYRSIEDLAGKRFAVAGADHRGGFDPKSGGAPSAFEQLVAEPLRRLQDANGMPVHETAPLAHELLEHALLALREDEVDAVFALTHANLEQIKEELSDDTGWHLLPVPVDASAKGFFELPLRQNPESGLAEAVTTAGTELWWVARTLEEDSTTCRSLSDAIDNEFYAQLRPTNLREHTTRHGTREQREPLTYDRSRLRHRLEESQLRRSKCTRVHH